MSNGGQKYIKDCKVGDEVIALDDNWNFVPAKITAVIDNGIKDVYEVSLYSGLSIKVTSNHPFLTPDGWLSMDDGLKVDDWVLAYEDFPYWVAIETIEYKGKQQTYGLEIEKYHNHITNGIVTHNTTIVLGRVLWELGKNPNLLIKIVCASEEQAKKRISFLRRHIETNKNLHELFPKLRPQINAPWSTTQLYVERDLISPDPSVEAAGVLGSFTGSHALAIIFDDIIDYRNAYVYPENLKKIEQAVYENWMNILSEDGYFVAIYTAWTENDVTLKMEKKTNLYYVLKRVIDDDFTPIWPEKYDKKKLMRKKQEIGETAFARQFQGKVITSKSTTFNIDAINRSYDYSIEFGEYPKNSLLFMGVDLGHRKSKGNPQTCIFTLAITPSKKRLPVSIKVGNFGSVQTAQYIISEYMKYRPEYILVENNGYQEMLQEWISLLDNGADLPLEGYFTGSQKLDLRTGIPGMAAEFERNLWIIPAKGLQDHPENCECGLCTWLRQLKNFPFGLTDTVMACWFAREAYRKLYGDDGNIGIHLLEIDKEDGEITIYM